MAVVGTGYWGRNHVRTLAALKSNKVISELVVCDVDAERAETMASEFGCEWCTDANALTSLGVAAATIANKFFISVPSAVQ